ncbi:hypothetical protein ACLMJK_003354 [Lecanora helva]
MRLSILLCALLGDILQTHAKAEDGSRPRGKAGSNQEVLGHGVDGERYKTACPDYKHYAVVPHRPLSKGPLALPYQRPAPHCRSFTSQFVEDIIGNITTRMENKDLARIFENAFPNTLDTTIKWHINGNEKDSHKRYQQGEWAGAQTFVVTGDINAEWLRDSTNQLAQYQALAKKDEKLRSLILGAINTQSEYVIESPYCNAFQPPPPSGIAAVNNGQDDTVHPAYEPSRVFECKYELDSLAHFLALGNQFYQSTGSKAFLNTRWYLAMDTILEVLTEQAKPTFVPSSGRFEKNEYQFQRVTTRGTETLALSGIGNPLAPGTGLIRSAFRPSDDTTILGFLIPANAMMAIELKRTSAILKAADKDILSEKLQSKAEDIEKGIWEHGVVDHKKYGRVFAFEVDGYGSSILMDDANLPSLLALPLLGFVEKSNRVYRNTRKMILEKAGNPYALTGKAFSGIGGPHVGLQHAWPMSRLVQAMTSDNDDEIKHVLEDVQETSRLGLLHESVNVNRVTDYTLAPAGNKTSQQADQYTKGTLERSQLSPSPFIQFHTWFSAAQSSHVYQPETVCLSTAHLPSGSVSSRYVYLKELDASGFVVYSNWGTSRKADDVRTNPRASLAFWWPELERQVRVEGRVERLSSQESQSYYGLRARGSRIGAWASEQSKVLPETEGERKVLDDRVRDIEKRFEGMDEIPVPDFWGGLRIIPEMVEFWQGRESRLHDRFRYTRDGEEGWKMERLSP